MRTWQSVNINLLKYAIREGLFKPFCLFLLVKINFPGHSIIYDYSPARLARRLKLHPKTVSRYIKKLLVAGFCTLHNGNLLFRNQDKIANDLGLDASIRRKIEVRPWNNIFQIELRLYSLVLKLNAAEQEFNAVVIHGFKIGKFLTNGEIRKAKKEREKRRFFDDLPEANEDTAQKFFSSRQCARLFNCSHASANEILNILDRLGYIKAKMRIELWQKSVSIEKFSQIRDGLNENLPGFFYFRQGNIQRHRGRELSFPM